MKLTGLIFLLCLLSLPAYTQSIGLNASVGIRKTISFNEQLSLEIRQQFQVSPEIEKYNQQYGDFFNQDGFWPIPDDDDDDDDNDDPDDPGPNELNDDPTRINFNWRSNTSTQFNYRPKRWLRTNSGYGLVLLEKETRHVFRAELDYRPLDHQAKKRKLGLAFRTLYQLIGSVEPTQQIWTSSLTPRIDLNWAFNKKYSLQLNHAWNGAWQNRQFQFERRRTNLNLVYIYKKMHRFTFSFQIQQRLDNAKLTQGLSFGYEARI